MLKIIEYVVKRFINEDVKCIILKNESMVLEKEFDDNGIVRLFYRVFNRMKFDSIDKWLDNCGIICGKAQDGIESIEDLLNFTCKSIVRGIIDLKWKRIGYMRMVNRGNLDVVFDKKGGLFFDSVLYLSNIGFIKDGILVENRIVNYDSSVFGSLVKMWSMDRNRSVLEVFLCSDGYGMILKGKEYVVGLLVCDKVDKMTEK